MRLGADDVAFEQFLDMGKCRCIDTLMMQKLDVFLERAMLFPAYNADISNIWFALPTMINREVIARVLDRYYSDNIESTIGWFRQYDEYYVMYRSAFLICNKMYEKKDELRIIYRKMIHDDRSYYPLIFNEQIARRLRWDY